MADEKAPKKIEQVRPPNPFDFSSICQFLEQVLSIGSLSEEYSRICSIIEQKNAEKSGDSGPKTTIQVFEDIQFEQALIRAFFSLSSALIKFKSLSPKEQDIKREFLAKGNDTSLKNALTAAGFPDGIGFNLVGKKLDEFKEFKLPKALNKANSVFDRAFYFQLKETELTKKSIDELVASVRTLEEVDDLKLYLEALLYKVEVASTEKSFNNLKKIIAAPISVIWKDAEKAFTDLQEGKYPEGKGPYSKEKLEEELTKLQERHETIGEYCQQYFCSDDFIYVEKNLLQFKKAKGEKQQRTNRCLLSDEFTASIDKKLIIQLVNAFKKCYNTKELKLLKGFILQDLVGGEDATDEDGNPSKKFSIKKQLVLDALKRIRQDMIVEDEFGTAVENKKNLIEAFEKEMLQMGPKQLNNIPLTQALKETEDIVSRAQRAIQRKTEDKGKEQEEIAKFHEEVDALGCSAVSYILDLYAYKVGKQQAKTFQDAMPQFDPHVKYLEHTVKAIESPSERDGKKALIGEYLNAFSAQSEDNSLNKDSERMFQTYLKGVIDRIKYW